MFLKYFDFIFQPFRAINNKIIGAKNIKGNIAVDINRSKALAARGKQFGQDAKGFNNKMMGAAGQQPQQGQPQDPNQQYAQQQQYGQQPQQGGYMQQPGQGMPGQPGMPGTP